MLKPMWTVIQWFKFKSLTTITYALWFVMNQTLNHDLEMKFGRYKSFGQYPNDASTEAL